MTSGDSYDGVAHRVKFYTAPIDNLNCILTLCVYISLHHTAVFCSLLGYFPVVSLVLLGHNLSPNGTKDFGIPNIISILSHTDPLLTLSTRFSPELTMKSSFPKLYTPVTTPAHSSSELVNIVGIVRYS